jgi:hypothetical protein
MTIGKYPSIGMDCRRSMKGVRINDAILLVAANIPKETPQTTDKKSVNTILEIVLKVYNGRFLTSGYGMKVTINQVITHKKTNPATKIAIHLRKTNSPT